MNDWWYQTDQSGAAAKTGQRPVTRPGTVASLTRRPPSRSSNHYDTNMTARPGSNNSSKFSAEQYKALPRPGSSRSVTASNSDDNAGHERDSGRQQNQGIGLAHVDALSRGGPLSDTSVQRPNLARAILATTLLTDGTEHSEVQTASLPISHRSDTRQKMTCDNVNAANITLYTIQVNTGGERGLHHAENCAGTAPGPEHVAQISQPGQEFRGHELERDRDCVQSDRHQPLEAAHCASLDPTG